MKRNNDKFIKFAMVNIPSLMPVAGQWSAGIKLDVKPDMNYQFSEI